MSHDVKPRDDFELPQALKVRFNLGGKGLFVLGILLTFGAYWFDHMGGIGAHEGEGAHGLHRFWWSAHVAFFFMVTITFGAIAFLAYNYVTRTKWHVVLRRVAENIALNIGWIALVGAIVMIFGNIGEAHGPFGHWLHADPTDAIMQKKAGYFELPFFIARSVIYLALAWGITVFLTNNSFAQDHDGDFRRTQQNQRFSTVFVIMMALLITFAGFDWSMALDPHWFSTMFGIYTFAGCLISIHCCLALAKHWFHKHGLLKNTITAEHDHDLGKLIIGFTIFWAYIAYSQFMLIWYANIPEETVWFAHRWVGSWKFVSMLLLFGKFFFPFFALMSRHVKKNAGALYFIVVWCLLMHYVDVYWQMMPVANPTGIAEVSAGVPNFNLLIVDVLVAMGFLLIFTGLFVVRTSRRALVPVKDPYLEHSIKFENF